MAGHRIVKPSITINAVEYQCLSKSVDFVPGDWLNYCEREWQVDVIIELSYGATGSFNLLDALRDTVNSVVIKPGDGAVAVGNPSATFDAVIPPVPMMTGAGRGDRMEFTLELVAEAEPVFAFA